MNTSATTSSFQVLDSNSSTSSAIGNTTLQKQHDTLYTPVKREIETECHKSHDTSNGNQENIDAQELYDIATNQEEFDEINYHNNVAIHSIGTESALYVQGTVNPDLYPEDSLKPNLQIVWDTRSFATVLSKRAYDQMPAEARPGLDRSNLHVTSASGALTNYYGKGEAQLELSGKQYGDYIPSV